MTLFADLELRQDILQGLKKLGFTAPTPVQEQVIPALLSGQNDLVAMAQTGTGKTAAFGLPLIQLTDNSGRQTQGLVICPTRELCMQVSSDLAAFGKYVPGLRVAAVYGGAPIIKQINELRRGAHIIVATPGRLLDLIRQSQVNISAIKILILDEADEMLQMGFQDDLNAIMSQTPATKKTLLFSATMPRSVAGIARKYMNNPLEITVGQRNTGTKNVRHVFYTVQARNRYAALKRIVDINPEIYGIIFCRTRMEAKDIADKLAQDGYQAEALHGDLSQAQRDHVMNKFRRNNIQVLVATDVAARGLDVKDLTHVINYNLPDEAANYTHRSGRTGRAGKTGTSISIINAREHYKIREIEGKINRKFERGRIPSGREVCEKQLLSRMEAIKKAEVDHQQISPFLPAIKESLAEFDREELINLFVAKEFNRFLKYYSNAPDLNHKERQRLIPETKGRQRGVKLRKDFAGPNPRFACFQINLGKKDGMNPKTLLGKINDAVDIPNIKIGRIEIMKNFATLEADSKFTDQILQAFQYQMVNGKLVSIKLTGLAGNNEAPRGARYYPDAKKGRKPFRSGKKG